METVADSAVETHCSVSFLHSEACQHTSAVPYHHLKSNGRRREINHEEVAPRGATGMDMPYSSFTVHFVFLSLSAAAASEFEAAARPPINVKEAERCIPAQLQFIQ